AGPARVEGAGRGGEVRVRQEGLHGRASVLLCRPLPTPQARTSTSGARRRRTAGQQPCDLRLQQVADGGVGAAEAEVLAAAAARDEVREPELPRGEERAQVRRGGVPPGCGLGLPGEEVGDLE